MRTVNVTRTGPDGEGGFIWQVTFTSKFQLGDVEPFVLGFEPVNFTVEELESGVRSLNMSVAEVVSGRAALNVARFRPRWNPLSSSIDGTWSRMGAGFAFGTVHALQAMPSVGDEFVGATRIESEHRLLVGGHLHFSSDDALEGFVQKSVAGRGLVFMGVADATATSTTVEELDAVIELNNGAWQNVNSGVRSSAIEAGVVMSLHVTASGTLVAGGSFALAGSSTSAQNIASIPGYVDAVSRSATSSSMSASWSSFEEGVEGTVQALSSDRFGNLYAGGAITRVGGYVTSNAGRWNGARWAKMSSGLNAEIRAMMVPSLPSVDKVEPSVISGDGGDTIFVIGPYLSDVSSATVANGASASSPVSSGGIELSVGFF